MTLVDLLNLKSQVQVGLVELDEGSLVLLSACIKARVQTVVRLENALAAA